MALQPRYLIDKSALTRLSNPQVARRLLPLMTEERIVTCAMVDLEMLYSARNHADYLAIRQERRRFPSVPITPAVMNRALDVQERLARTGHHRLSIPDLIIAAAAETKGHVLLHYDADFERIAAVTRQKHRWVVPRGSLGS